MSTHQFQLDTQRHLPALNYLRGIRRAKVSGKGFLGMLWEVLRLRFAQGRLNVDEYFMYGLYDDERFSYDVKKTFVGSSASTVPNSWASIAQDKPTLTAMLRGLDLPIPETQAIVHEQRTFAGAKPLRNNDDVCRFLRKEADYPIFGKPFDSVCSLGTSKICDYDRDEDALVLPGDRLVKVEEFASAIEKLGRAYIFQTLLLPHEDTVPIIGSRVSTVRMYVLSDDEGCVLLRASWKIPAGENGADNFWRPGNMLAGIDVETGRIIRTLIRTTEGTEPITRHPHTGADFSNLVFPEWEAMRETVLRAAVNLPGCFCQGWDVALTDRGPVLVELEGDGGDPIMEQLCFDSGLLQGRFKKLIDSMPEREKERLKERKERKRAKIKRDIAALAMPRAGNKEEPQTADSDRAGAAGESKVVIAPVTTTEAMTDSSVQV